MSERYGQITKSERAMLEVMRTFRVMEKAQLSTYMKKLDFNKYDIANALDESKFNRKLFEIEFLGKRFISASENLPQNCLQITEAIWVMLFNIINSEVNEFKSICLGTSITHGASILFYTKNNYMYYVVRAFSREEAAVNMVAMQEKIQEYSSTIVMDYTRVLILVNTDDLSTLSLPRVSYTYMCVKVNRSDDGKIKVLSVKE